MKRIIQILIILVIAIVIAGVTAYYGLWIPNALFARAYPVRGIDVSHHQKQIDWGAVAGEKVDFVYMKATEGGDFVDRNFAQNWKEADANGIPRGAYHFFTFRSTGRKQAEHFIATVPKEPGALPPVVDLEYWGNSATRPSVAAFRKELDEFMGLVRAAYGKEPMIYTDYPFYEHFLADYPIERLWIRDIVTTPNLYPSMRKWTFWQYTSRDRIRGVETFVDRNVFRGSREEFAEFARAKNN